MTYNPYSDMCSNKITVNGVTMTMTQFKKMKRQAQEKKRKKKEQTEIQLLPEDVNHLLKGIKVIDSLMSFYRNGYKQWGRIYHEVMKVDDMKHYFILLKLAYHDVNEKIKEIAESAKHSHKSTYGIISDLSFKMMKLGERLNSLYVIIHDSNIINSPFYKHEIISGNGRRLGLKVLLYRTNDALNNMTNIISNLQNMSVIPDSYYDNTTKFIDKRMKGI